MKSGDIYKIADVVRNLSFKQKEKGLSTGVQAPLHRRGYGVFQSRSHGDVPPGKPLSNRPFAWQQEPHYRA